MNRIFLGSPYNMQTRYSVCNKCRERRKNVNLKNVNERKAVSYGLLVLGTIVAGCVALAKRKNISSWFNKNFSSDKVAKVFKKTTSEKNQKQHISLMQRFKNFRLNHSVERKIPLEIKM